MDFPVLQTARLALRELNLADKEALFRIFSDEGVTGFYNIPTFTSLQDSQKLLERRISRYWTGKGISWGITLRGSRELIGGCSFNAWLHGRSVGELGYELARPYWNQGIMTEALTAVIRYGFETARLQRAQAWVMPQNVASARVLAKLGFTDRGVRENMGYWNGRFHDLTYFVLLSSHYRQQQESQKRDA